MRGALGRAALFSLKKMGMIKKEKNTVRAPVKAPEQDAGGGKCGKHLEHSADEQEFHSSLFLFFLYF